MAAAENKNPRPMIHLVQEEEKKKPDPNDWVEIGTLKHVIIYPIDGGAGCTQDHSVTNYFSKYGLSNAPGTAVDYQDRALVLFSRKNMQAKIRLYNTLSNLNSQSLYKAIARTLKNRPTNLKTEQIKYIDEEDNIEVSDLGDEIAKIIAEKLGGTDVDLRLGLRKSESRHHYNHRIRSSLKPISSLSETFELNVFSQNFSSYTLVNTTHIKALQTECKKEISYTNFRPNLVVEGIPGVCYKEEHVIKIKITDEFEEIEFPIIRPWTHNNSINDSTSETPEDKLGEPYDTLIKTRPISTVYPYKFLEVDVPVFGINMEMDFEATDEKRCMLPGARVFAKFMEVTQKPHGSPRSS